MRILDEVASVNQIVFLWQKYINPLVAVKELTNVVSMLARKGAKIDYILFCLIYAIKHQMNLKHPAGLAYIVDKDYILREYKLSQIKRVDIYDFKAIESDFVAFTYKKESKGFQQILNKGSK